MNGNKYTPSSGDGKTLVAYFSCTGTTEKLAKALSDTVGGALYKITPAVEYTADDLKYYTDCRADREQQDPTARPQITGSVSDMNKYSIIYLGYPIWHGQAPKIIYTFLESYDMSDKTVIPFCTSGSSDIGSSATNLRACAPGAAFKKGRRFSKNADRLEIAEWTANY